MSDLIERAKAFHVEHLPLAKYDWTPSERLTNFAQSERTRIADEIEALSQKTPIDAMVTALLAYADKLRKND